MNDWSPLTTKLPNAKVTQLEINYSPRNLRASTYGRGLWETSLAGDNEVVNILGIHAIGGNQYQISFSVVNGTGAAIQLFKADTVNGAWTLDAAATVVTNGSPFQATTVSTQSQRFFRIQTQ